MLHSSRRHLEAVVRDSTGRQLARCVIRRGRYVIGHEYKNEIVVDEPSVSSTHARLTIISETEFFIEDLGSANGTLVDAKPANGLTPVGLESTIEIGRTTLSFQRASLPATVFENLPEGFLRQHRYNLGESVVQGSTSTIFEAYDTSLARDIAIKVMRPECQTNAPQVLRFIREAQLTSQLQHPNILPIYELNLDEQSQLYFTTRFVEGESLSTILENLTTGEPRTLARYHLPALLAVFQKVCDAVAFAHSRGVVHCGLRPDAITVGRHGEVFVVNWNFAGILAVNEDGAPFPQPVHAAPADGPSYTTAYSAPEQADGSESFSPRTDVYALGGILYMLLTLHTPLPESSEAALIAFILSGDIDPAATRVKTPLPHCPRGHVPEPLAALAMKALSLRPADRPGSVHALQNEIAAWQAGLLQSDAGLWKHIGGLLGRH